jgi:PAS domain-containing protein
LISVYINAPAESTYVPVICCVDENEAFLTTIKKGLETTGEFLVETAISVSGGRDMLKTRPVDAVISGFHLPDGDGIAFLKEVRENYGSLPFILVAGHLPEEVIIDALNNGADFYLGKDGDQSARFPELMQKIRQLVAGRRAEASARADAERVRLAQEMVDAGTWEYDILTGKIWLSEAAAQIYGVSRPPDGFLPLQSVEACMPEREKIHRALVCLIEQEEEYNLEYPVETADGSGPKIVSSTGRLIRNPAGNAVRVIGTIRDITRIKSRDAAFQATVRSIVASIGLESLDRITESVASWLGADCVMIGEIMPGRERVRVLSMVLDGNHVKDFFYTLKGSPCENVTEKGYCIYPKNAVSMFPTAKDMVELQIQGYAGTAMRNAEGTVMGILCILTRQPLSAPPALQEIIDLIAVKATAEIERKQAEELIRKSQVLLAEAMDLAHLANWEFDIATGTLTVDDRFYRLYGTTAQQEGVSRMTLEGYIREFVHPDDHVIVTAEFTKALGATDPQYVSLCGHRIVGRDGEIRHILMRIGITTDLQARTITIHGANQDITELKLAEQALLQANHKINLLSNITRHDILNQIQAIRMYLELAKQRSSDTEMTRMIKKLEETVQKIQLQIEFTRVYQDLGTHEPQWQLLDAVLHNIVVPDHFTLQANLKGFEVYADPILEKVFYNLMDNSLQHGEHVSTVRSSAREQDGSLIVVWEDDGVGIPFDEKTKIFEKGYGRNTGLGLFLISEILAITGITIRETGEPGKGARFEMIVPKGEYRFTGA